MKSLELKNRNEIIGKKIFDLRYYAYFSQPEFAQKLQLCGLDIDTVTLLKIEKVRRYMLTAEIPYFAKALEMSIENFTKYIFSDDE